jgi:sirohydrochlorin ferrochelatase
MAVSEPVFVIATDLRPGSAAWSHAADQAAGLRESVARPLGVAPVVDLACLPTRAGNGPPEFRLATVLDRHAAAGATELFVMPAALEFNIWQRSTLGEELIEARRRHPAVSIHHDSVDPSSPLLLDCFAGLALGGIREMGAAPQQAGLLLVADGQGDPGTRADSYRLMRLLWEQTGAARGDVGFVRHTEPFLRDALEGCLNDSLAWVLVPQCQWDGDLCEYARVLLADHQRAHPEAVGWCLADPPGDHPAITGWFEQRMRRLWQEKRARQAARVPSAKYRAPSTPTGVWSGKDWVAAGDAAAEPRAGLLGREREPEVLTSILTRVLPPADRYLVKVTWHGYAQGTYTGPAALDRLLAALPGRAVLLEGHTSGRNVGGLNIDWEADAAKHRTWIRQQETEFLRRTGLADVIAKHKAQYVNVTEAWWDGACAPVEEVQAALGDVTLQNPELTGFVPSVLMELRGAPLISFARFKGPTRLGISNLFGLIPHPLRTAWHGAAITDFAAVCCDLARLYGRLFPTFGLVEAFDSAVRWDRKGLYRSRWGNYDLVLTDGLFTLSEGLVGADILASRLQGQDVSRSGFFNVVRDRLGWSDSAAEMTLPGDIQASLV